MTSNIGSRNIQEWDGENYNQLENTLHNDLSKYFRPEFINRIDDVVIFNRIDRDDMNCIVGVQLKQLTKQIKLNKLIDLEFSDSARDALSELGYDESYGARPLKRIIQTRILNELASKIIKGEIVGNSKVKIDYDDDKFEFIIK